MRVLVLGGDGYLGWPTALRLSMRGHEVAVIDSFARRRWHVDRGTASLTPIRSLAERIGAWREVSGREILASIGDVRDAGSLDPVIREFMPEAVVHYAEQPSAPFSMASRREAIETQSNNVLGTLNLLFALNELAPDCHLIKLGTMGEYGTPDIDIEEGYIEIAHKGRRDVLPFPKLPGSFYHLSKVHDSHNIQFACRTWGMRATELNQGIVYGIETAETAPDERLLTRFDYDGVFGTALNRFCVQAVLGHPLTVYGSGTQTRGFLNLRDTLQCVELALSNPPDRGRLRVFNQFTEQFSVIELAELVRDVATHAGRTVVIKHYANPRAEDEHHYYNAVNAKLLALGLTPRLLGDELLRSMFAVIERYRDRAVWSAIEPSVRWRTHAAPDVVTEQTPGS